MGHGAVMLEANSASTATRPDGRRAAAATWLGGAAQETRFGACSRDRAATSNRAAHRYGLDSGFNRLSHERLRRRADASANRRSRMRPSRRSATSPQPPWAFGVRLAAAPPPMNAAEIRLIHLDVPRALQTQRTDAGLLVGDSPRRSEPRRQQHPRVLEDRSPLLPRLDVHMRHSATAARPEPATPSGIGIATSKCLKPT